MPQLLKAESPRPMLFSKRSLHTPTRESPCPATKTQHSQISKIKAKIFGRFTDWERAQGSFQGAGNILYLGVGSIYIELLLFLFGHWVVSNSLRPHGLQHARLPCPSLSPRVCSDSCPLSWWCYLTIPSIDLFSSQMTELSLQLQRLYLFGSRSLTFNDLVNMFKGLLYISLLNFFLSRKKWIVL